MRSEDIKVLTVGFFFILAALYEKIKKAPKRTYHEF